MLSFLVACPTLAQVQSQRVAPTPQYQGFQDQPFGNNSAIHSEKVIPMGNSIGIQRHIPSNAVRDLSRSQGTAQQGGVMIQNTGRQYKNQQFIDQSLGRKPALENRAR